VAFDIAPTSWAGKPHAEIVSEADRDGSIVVVPVGSIEQHGHHLPVAADSILADAVATLGAERVSDDVLEGSPRRCSRTTSTPSSS
jgi:creatinine amidohydrolase